MGQRLVLNFTHNDESVVTFYQHWSGYTYNALETLYELSYQGNKNGLFEATTPHEKIEKLIKALMTIGYVNLSDEQSSTPWLEYVTANEIEMNKNKPIQAFNKRNDGLIDIEQAGIENSLDWAEMLIFIDIDSFVLNVLELFDCIDADEFDEDEHEYLFSGDELTFDKLLEEATPLEHGETIDLSDDFVVDDLRYTFANASASVYQLKGMGQTILCDYA